MAKNILIICEGAVEEPEIFNRVRQLGLLPADVHIFSYKTNIHKLYHYLDEQGWDSLDIQQVLLTYASTDEEKSVLERKYTDILLIFDLDPQDGAFRNHLEDQALYKKFDTLFAYFSESTGQGKLYMSYPMIEALRHIPLDAAQPERLDTSGFNCLDFGLRRLRRSKYKMRVREEGEPSITCYDRRCMVELLCAHVKKAEYLTGRNGKGAGFLTYDEAMLRDLFEKEFQSLKKRGIGYVVSTSLFYIAESYPDVLLDSSDGQQEFPA